MDILVPDSWLREYLDTKATPEKVAECLSLCGPSFERIHKTKEGIVYDIEVTTNRVDSASVYGIAREAVAILPRFGMHASLKPFKITNTYPKQKLSVGITGSDKLVSRIMAVELEVKNGQSSKRIQDYLTSVGQRPINKIVDITNFIMYGIGVPVHAFDLAKLKEKKIIVREAKKGEHLVTLDGVTRTLKGGEVVFDDGKGTIIDLPGIMGAQNTMVDEDTSSVLLCVEHIDPLKIRETSLTHELRTQAAVLNEKNVDVDALPQALHYAVALFQSETDTKVISELFDWYPSPRIIKSTIIDLKRIQSMLGVEITKEEVDTILRSLGFETKWKGQILSATPSSYRADDVQIPEDIVEEVARIYGYFKLPSNLPEGKLPQEPRDEHFRFETKIKTLLKGWGGMEVYTLSMVSKEMAGDNALRILNPLGGDGEYMRREIAPSLIAAASENSHERSPFHLFEIANVYKPQGKKLPVEEIHVAGIFANTEFRTAKGVLEALFNELHMSEEPVLRKVSGYYVYEYSLNELMTKSKPYIPFTPIPKFPGQIEDVTVMIDGDIRVQDVIQSIKASSELIVAVVLTDIYEDSYTFRITYQHPQKTLTDSEVHQIRAVVLKTLEKLKVSVK